MSGPYKQATQIGINAVVALVMVYAVTVMIPSIIDKHDTSLKEAREQGFSHGEKAVEKLVLGMDRLGDKFGSVQTVTQSRQAQIIEGIDKTNEILAEQTKHQKAQAGSIRVIRGTDKPPTPNE